MKKIYYLLKRMILCFFVLYGFNIVGMHFNFLLPINIISFIIVFIFGVPGAICLILFKIIL